ncbi:MazG-like family protein [Streptomyces nigrescens]|uniref:MazG-like family protein n=1 Tax=Streptomyces nigrescens TaxID=1920 RepID=UPI00347AEF73
MTDTWQTIARLAGLLEDHSDLPREQRILLQLLKIQEEAGEVAEAVIGAMGQNPRKGHSHTWDDVEAEVCDVIVTGMVALARMNPDAEAMFARHMDRIASRDLVAQGEVGDGQMVIGRRASAMGQRS